MKNQKLFTELKKSMQRFMKICCDSNFNINKTYYENYNKNNYQVYFSNTTERLKNFNYDYDIYHISVFNKYDKFVHRLSLNITLLYIKETGYLQFKIINSSNLFGDIILCRINSTDIKNNIKYSNNIYALLSDIAINLNYTNIQ